MIRPLRQRHRRQILALAIFLPAAFLLGLAARNPVPVLDAVPRDLVPDHYPASTLVWARDRLFSKSPVSVHLWRLGATRLTNSQGPQASLSPLGISFSAAADFVQPDLMVYWVPQEAFVANVLPTNAILLGNFGPIILPLPGEAVLTNGELVLYSLADGEVMDVSKTFRLNEESPPPASP